MNLMFRIDILIVENFTELLSNHTEKKKWLIDWFINWFIDWLSDWLIDWLNDWMSKWVSQCESEDPGQSVEHSYNDLNIHSSFYEGAIACSRLTWTEDSHTSLGPTLETMPLMVYSAI